MIAAGLILIFVVKALVGGVPPSALLGGYLIKVGLSNRVGSDVTVRGAHAAVLYRDRVPGRPTLPIRGWVILLGMAIPTGA